MDNFISDNYLIQIVGIPDLFRGKELEIAIKNLSLDVVSGVGVKLSENDFLNEKFHDKNLGQIFIKRSITIGEVGTRLAHKAAAKRFLESHKTVSIVLEDDAHIVEPIDLQNIFDLINVDEPRVLLLGWEPKYTVFKFNPNKQFANLLAIPPTGAFAYAMNIKAAEIIVNDQNKIYDLADWPVVTYDRIKFYAVNFPCVSLESVSGNSVIDFMSPRKFNQKNFWQKLISYLKILNVIVLKKPNNLSYKQLFLFFIARDFLFSRSKWYKLPNFPIDIKTNRVFKC